jgi:hypothetical protein
MNLSVEASLPRLIFGHNKKPVSRALLPLALADLQYRVREFLPMAPDVMSMEVRRVDATRDIHLAGEAEVRVLSEVLRGSLVHGVYPFSGESGVSLRWVKRGRPVCRAYGKSAESGDSSIAGQFRVEVQAGGRKALDYAFNHGDLTLAALPGGQDGRVFPLTLIEGSGVCAGLLGPLVGVLSEAVGLVKGGDGVTSLQALDLLMSKGGVKFHRANQLLGYAHLVRTVGWSGLDPHLSRQKQHDARKVFAERGKIQL